VAGSERRERGAAPRAVDEPKEVYGKLARQSSGGPDTRMTGPPLA